MLGHGFRLPIPSPKLSQFSIDYGPLRAPSVPNLSTRTVDCICRRKFPSSCAAELGPVIGLIHAELISATKLMTAMSCADCEETSAVIGQTPDDVREALAGPWPETFARRKDLSQLGLVGTETPGLRLASARCSS